MSFAIFKQSMLSYMQNQGSIDTYQDFAKKLTDEYDLLIRRGFQTINNIPLQTPNKPLMLTLMNVACLTSLTKRSGKHNFIDDIGKAVLGYWTGATLVVGIPPIIPASFAVSNISTTSAFVINPGIWKPVGPINPTDDSSVFLDRLISSMQTHLTTIQGLYITISL